MYCEENAHFSVRERLLYFFYVLVFIKLGGINFKSLLPQVKSIEFFAIGEFGENHKKLTKHEKIYKTT